MSRAYNRAKKERRRQRCNEAAQPEPAGQPVTPPAPRARVPRPTPSGRGTPRFGGGNTITNCRSYNNGGAGFLIDGADVSMSGNEAWGNGGAGFEFKNAVIRGDGPNRASGNRGAQVDAENSDINADFDIT